ncbi:glycosyltransferase family 4 protein [bacterium]|nr:glycosyltransferase family 4 protein [bacterium]
MKVIISCCGWFHARHAAYSAYKAGILDKFITTNIYESKVPKELTKKIPLIEKIEWYSRKIPLLNRLANFNLVKKKLYDKIASGYIDNDCNIFHGFSSLQEESFKLAKERGGITIVDRGIAHPLKQIELLSEFLDTKKLPSKRNIERQIEEFCNADYVFVPSQFVYDSFIEYGFDQAKLIHLPFGVDIEDFKPGIKKDNIFRIIFVGMLCFRKGVHLLIKAFDELNLSKSELILIGNIKDEIKPILRKYRNTENLKVMGSISHSALTDYYCNSSCFVFPSFLEGSAYVTYEAMACGLPIVVTPNTGAVIQDGQEGFIVPVRCVDSLKEKILLLYENKELREQMSKNAVVTARKFTWKTYGERLIRIYEQIVK